MSNVIKAFTNIVEHYSEISIDTINVGSNRINNMGEGLEVYIKDIFANVISENDNQKKMEIFEKVYSYQGNKNNPPDLILKNGDAIEIKKIQTKGAAIALNSSYPKSKLYADSPMITKACKSCENWISKDMVYTVGYVDKNILKSLWMVYGDCFCADKEVYERIKDTISSGINTIPDVEFTKTKELGKVKKVDPLGITNLRIRGMWHIENPNNVFNYIYTFDKESDFQLICLMQNKKYKSFPIEDRNKLESISANSSNLKLEDVKIKDPNNPVKLLDAKLFIFRI